MEFRCVISTDRYDETVAFSAVRAACRSTINGGLMTMRPFGVQCSPLLTGSLRSAKGRLRHARAEFTSRSKSTTSMRNSEGCRNRMLVSVPQRSCLGVTASLR